jgi:thiamine-monophosphate kinase
MQRQSFIIPAMRENDFLAWIARHTPAHPRVPLNVGDDMATVRLPTTAAQKGSLVLLKIDQCLDQVHFDLRQHTPTQAGRKAVNRCLSDCAAMACVPAAILISVALPREGPGSGEAAAQELFLACQGVAAAFDCPLVGGDTAIWDQRLAITVAALGMPADAAEVHRSGAQPGDTLFVSGQLGGSIRGRHLTFTPRIDLALKLKKAAGAHLHALMDLSDGLAQDLPRLCAASGVGAEVHTAQLPIHPDAEALAQADGIPAGLHALADGEDYELLFALAPEAVPEIVNLTDVPLTAIGAVTTNKELKLIDGDGRSHPWPRAGWEHHSP